MVIGGAEDKVREKVLLARFVRFAGGADGHIVVISTASSLGERATEVYRELFVGMGIGSVSGLRPEEREEADDAEAARLLVSATGVFLTGGNRIPTDPGRRRDSPGRRARERARPRRGPRRNVGRRLGDGVAHGGVRAAGRDPEEPDGAVVGGARILHGIVIDQHFEQRGRYGRLLALVAQSPSLLGVGVDEDTCAIVFADQTMHVLGKGAVTIVDGRHVKTDAYRGKGYKPLMVSGAVLHSIPSGYWFDLRRRELMAGSHSRLTEREASE